MKSIKKNNGSFLMLGCFIGILLLFILLISKTPENVTKDEIEFEEVLTLIMALDEDLGNREEYNRLLMQYEKQSTTYEMIRNTLKILEPAGVITDGIMKDLPDNKEVDRDDFFKLYEEILDSYHKKDVIVLKETSIIGIGKKEGETDAINEAVLVTTDQNGICNENNFSKYAGYTVKAYVKKTEDNVEYLAVVDFWEDKIYLPYSYVTGGDGEGLHIMVNDSEVILPYKQGVKVKNDTIASLIIKGGAVIKAELFDEKINGKVLTINENMVRIENCGSYELKDDMKIYKVYDGLKEGDIADVALGYEFVDFVLDDDKVCACLIMAKEEMEYIRVLIKTTGFASSYHEKVIVEGDCAYKIYQNEEVIKVCSAGEESTIEKKDLSKSDIIKIVPDVLSGKISLKSVSRNQGTPCYGGSLEMHLTDEGIVLINELLLEEYLYTVVPSEMPSYFDEQALMAQAVCARTYAYSKMQNAALKELGAHLDDSTSFQVYNNIEEQVSTTNAVRRTSGQILKKEGQILETQYYSTSFGVLGDGRRLSKEGADRLNLSTNTAFDEYILTKNESDYEIKESFYRWRYETSLDEELLENRLKECYNKNKNNVRFLNGKGEYEATENYSSLGNLREIYVSERSAGGRAEKVILKGEKNTIQLRGEYQIRYCLLNENKTILKQDENKAEMAMLLPSAFFEIETGEDKENVIGYSIVGGGYGHGNGMSQNGAGKMAENGCTYTEILQFFYEDGNLEQIY